MKPPYPQTQEGATEAIVDVDLFSPLVCPELDTVPSMSSFATNGASTSLEAHFAANQNVAPTFSCENGGEDIDFTAFSSFLPSPTTAFDLSTLAAPQAQGTATASATFFDVADSMSMDWIVRSANPSTAPPVDTELHTLPALSFGDQADFSLASVDFNVVEQTRALAAAPSGLSAGRRRRPKVAVSDDVKQTEKYKQRRAKNNAAAARNRQMHRAMTGARVAAPTGTELRNLDLRSECDALRLELDALVRVVQTRVMALAS